MSDLFQAIKGKAEALLNEINRPGGMRSTIETIRRKMAEADQRRAIQRAHAELERLESQMNETITAVGLQTVALYEAQRLQSAELEPLCKHVVEIKAALGEQREELAALEALAAARADQQAELCTTCGRPLPAQGVYCPHCGTPIQQRLSHRFCAHCGAGLRDDARFCPRCGVPADR